MLNPAVCVVVALSLLGTVFGQGGLRLAAVPSNVVNGTTEKLEIKCTAPSIDQSVNFIVLMRMEKADGDVITAIASEQPTGTKLSVTDNRTSAEGSLSGQGGAFLSITIDSPVFEDTGLYQCRFAYLNLETFKATILTKEINVTFTEPDQPTPPPIIADSCSCDQVWEEVKSLRETLIAENRELKSQLGSYDDKCRVSFAAMFADRTGNDFRSNQVARFDTAVSNKGKAYDTSNGVFTAPCAGQYFFQLSLRTHQQGDSGYVDGVIEVNDEARARTSVFTDDVRDHYEQASNGVVLTLAKGDKVQVRIQTNSYGEFYGGVFTVFSGFFISP